MTTKGLYSLTGESEEITFVIIHSSLYNSNEGNTMEFQASIVEM